MSALAHIVHSHEVERARRRVKHDIGPEREIEATYDGGGEEDLRLVVRYRVDYGSVRDRLHGHQPEVEILGVWSDDGIERKAFRLTPMQLDWVRDEIATREGFSEACCGD